MIFLHVGDLICLKESKPSAMFVSSAAAAAAHLWLFFWILIFQPYVPLHSSVNQDITFRKYLMAETTFHPFPQLERPPLININKINGTSFLLPHQQLGLWRPSQPAIRLFFAIMTSLRRRTLPEIHLICLILTWTAFLQLLLVAPLFSSFSLPCGRPGPPLYHYLWMKITQITNDKQTTAGRPTWLGDARYGSWSHKARPYGRHRQAGSDIPTHSGSG